jgi:hypothetical protein
MRLLIVEAPGVLYPYDQQPPNADPIYSGLRFVRALTEGYGVSVLIVGQLSAVDPDMQLKEWLRIYDVQHAWILTGDGSKPDREFWETDVLTYIGKLRGTPTMAVVPHTPTATMLARRSVPVLRFLPPVGKVPDWGPTNSSWASKQPVEEAVS